VAALAAYGIQQLQGAPADRAVAAEIHQLTAVVLEYQAAPELQDKVFQVGQEYVSTTTVKIHTTAVVAVEQAAQV
jgi:hypothetical protein